MKIKQPLLHNPVLQGQAKSNSCHRSCKRVGSSWLTAANSAVTQRPACAQDRTAQGLTSRKGAERSLTCCAPRKGVKVGGTPPLPSTGRHLAVREMGIPKQQKNRAQSFPLSCQLYIGLLSKELTVKELASLKSLAIQVLHLILPSLHSWPLRHTPWRA